MRLNRVTHSSGCKSNVFYSSGVETARGTIRRLPQRVACADCHRSRSLYSRLVTVSSVSVAARALRTRDSVREASVEGWDFSNS